MRTHRHKFCPLGAYLIPIHYRYYLTLTTHCHLDVTIFSVLVRTLSARELQWLSCDLQPLSGRPETWTLNEACEQSHDHSTNLWCLHSANVSSQVSIPTQEHKAFCPGSFINFLMRIYIFRPLPKCWFCCQAKGERTWSHWWHEESGERESPPNVPFIPPDNFTSTDEISTCKWI